LPEALPIPHRDGSLTLAVTHRFPRRGEIAARNDNLDISWLRDTSNDPEDEMTEPDELAVAITTHLKNALEEIDAYSEELSKAKEGAA
jgi:hypothetical protein